MSLIELGQSEAGSQKGRVVSFRVKKVMVVDCLTHYVVLGVRGSYLKALVDSFDSSGSFKGAEASLIRVNIDKTFGFQRVVATAFDFPYLGMTLIQQIDCNSLGFHLHNFSN